MSKGKVIGAILLSAVMAVGGATAGWYACDQDWFGIVAGRAEAGADTDMQTGGLTVSPKDSNGISLTALRMSATADMTETTTESGPVYAESSYIIEATVTPSDASNPELDWAAPAWVNPNSEWASGKAVSDYVTILPTGDGSKKAMVTCNQSFGEPITISCTSRENPNKTASATLNYKKQILDIAVVMKKDGVETNAVDWSNDGYLYTWEVIPTESEYTIDREYSYYTHLHTNGEFHANLLVALENSGIRHGTRTISNEGYSRYASLRTGTLWFKEMTDYADFAVNIANCATVFSNVAKIYPIFDLDVQVGYGDKIFISKTFTFNNGTCDITYVESGGSITV